MLTALVSFERVFEVLDAKPAIVESPDAVPLHEPVGRVEVDDVWFRYPAPSEVSIASLEADLDCFLDVGWDLEARSEQVRRPGRDNRQRRTASCQPVAR